MKIVVFLELAVLVLVHRGSVRYSFLKSSWIIRTIYSNSERSEQGLVTEFFLTCALRFLISNKSGELEFKLEKLLGFRNLQEKLEKIYI